MSATAYLLRHAYVDGAVRGDVRVEIEDGRFTRTEAGADPRGAEVLDGLTLPGLANCHSHAFHRALRGHTQHHDASGRGSFWTWREQMYAVAARLDPDSYYALARATYREMVAGGITTVGEFHYLHHQPDGTPYADPAAMGHALIAAARDAGIRIALLDTCYVAGGFGEAVSGAQVRYSDGHAEAWAERVSALSVAGDDVVVGAAIHSVRAVPREQLSTVARWAAEHEAPLHVHLSEQVAENDACLAAHGVTPTALLAEAGALGPRTSAVHATHLSAGDVEQLGASTTRACLCPTTERDLGDGTGPARSLHEAGSPLTLGSDSHAMIDLFEEMRAVELDERLATQQRGHWTAPELLDAATGNGHESLGFPDAGRIAVGQRADLVTVRLDSVRTAGTGATPEAAVFAAAAPDVRRVVAGGRVVFTADDRTDDRTDDRDATTGPRSAPSWASRSTPSGGPMSSHLVTGIGELATAGDDGTRAVQVRAGAALVVEAGRIAWVGDAAEAPAADTAQDVGGRAVIPGFVDSHSHLLFAGDRSAEFAARMSGQAYAAGGIRTTVAATRGATDEQLEANLVRHVGEMRRQGTTTVEIKSGYGLSVLDEARGLAVASRYTRETTFLGAHVVPEEYADDPAGYVDLVTGAMLDAAAPYARWIDVFCESGAFDADQARAVLAAGAAHGLAGRLHANQLTQGDGVRLACELGLHAVDHCTYLADADVDALAASGTVATLLPGVEFSTRQPYPDARRLLDAGVTVALASDCNPGSCYTSSVPLCIALAVREMAMTPAQALWSATAGGARALGRDDVGALRVGTRAHLAVLDAPSYVHLAYRPGVPLVADVIV